MMFWRKSDLSNIISDRGVCRAALATQSLLMTGSSVHLALQGWEVRTPGRIYPDQAHGCAHAHDCDHAHDCTHAQGCLHAHFNAVSNCQTSSNACAPVPKCMRRKI